MACDGNLNKSQVICGNSLKLICTKSRRQFAYNSTFVLEHHRAHRRGQRGSDRRSKKKATRYAYRTVKTSHLVVGVASVNNQRYLANVYYHNAYDQFNEILQYGKVHGQE